MDRAIIQLNTPSASVRAVRPAQMASSSRELRNHEFVTNARGA
jgi:hypothetical protein